MKLSNNHATTIAKMDNINLLINTAAAKAQAEMLSEVDSQEQLRSMLVSMFNDLALFCSQAKEGEQVVMILNFIGLALDNDLNVAKMQAEADARLLLFKDELSRRSDASS